jgi:predicted  nucleic acid-binding Zn-ribbon protein
MAEDGSYQQQAIEGKPPLWQRTTEKLLAVTPIRKVSNHEYAETLHGRISTAERELQSVNGQMKHLQERLDELRREKDEFR